MEKVLKSFLKREANEAALYLQAERRDAERNLISGARAALFFRNPETAREFQKICGGECGETFTVGVGDARVYGITISPALAREAHDSVKDLPFRENKPRGVEKTNGNSAGHEPAPTEEPRRATAREMEEMARIVMRNLQTPPHERRQQAAAEPRPAVERPTVIAGFRADKLIGFLREALPPEGHDASEGPGEDEGVSNKGGKDARTLRHKGWNRH